MSEVRVVEYEPRWRDDFARLNLEWLQMWFTVEDSDRVVLDDPETHLIARGGRILFAIDDADHAIGTVALRRDGDGRVELTKMAVQANVRGGGIGRKLMSAALATFEEMDARELFLETNTKLEAAIALYESVGFRHRTLAESHYDRADVYMVWEP